MVTCRLVPCERSENDAMADCEIAEFDGLEKFVAVSWGVH